MFYLGQPIFPFTPNWRDALSRDIQFELRPEDVGYGPEYFTPTQSWTVNQWQFSVELPTPAQIVAYKAFAAGQVGPLKGFWLPMPLAAAQITAGASTSVFSVVSEGLSTFWQDRPDTTLFFTFKDGTQAAAQIQSVVPGGATETVTLTAPLPQVPDANTQIEKLQFCRFAADKQQYKLVAEGYQIRRVTVIELPLEYAGALVGLRPIFLFHFWGAAPVNTHWYYTSFASPVVSAGQIYTNFQVDFSDLEDAHDGTSQPLKLEAKPNPASPLSLFLPVPFSGILYCEIFTVDYSAPDVQTLFFSGRVVSVEDGGSKLTATCESRLAYLKRKILRALKGLTCGNIYCDPATCKIARAYEQTTVNIVAINPGPPMTVVCTFALPAFAAKFQPANFCAQGLFESGLGLNYEARTILASVWNPGTQQLTLTLNLALQKTQPGAQAEVTDGCDHQPSTCISKNNYQNFFALPFVPPRNPTLKGINANPVSQGGK